MQFSPSITYRFKKDHNLPIPIHFKESFFRYYLDIMSQHLFPDVKRQWDSMKSMISDYGSMDELLERYALLKDAVINYIKNNQKYEEFNSCALPTVKNDVASSSIYNDANIGKVFLSIDLRHANFQTLRKFGVVPNMKWHEFIGIVAEQIGFNDSEEALIHYVADSKYTRQVIFGQCNPKRTIAFEKVYINQVRDVLDRVLVNYRLVSKNADELVYKIPSGKDFYVPQFDYLHNIVMEELGLDVRISPISFVGVKLKTDNDYTVASGYLNTTSDPNKFKCVPEPYMPMFIEWYNACKDSDERLNDFDNFSLYSQYVVHDGVICRIDEKMHIDVIEKE